MIEKQSTTKPLSAQPMTDTRDASLDIKSLDADLQLAIACAEEKKAENIVALDLRKIVSFTEFFLIASGTNQRQVQAIADEIVEKLKESSRRKPARIEGYNAAEWILLDYGDFIFHIFDQKAREFYDLERLWRDAARVNLQLG
ncbi:MAG TPA: ribosome silencing factor [Pyrinomonadaceae bacterium]|jgi:ribosome-associated protein|nr:ribosome silencing factor [Pyrinomonadaceae bacterium]